MPRGLPLLVPRQGNTERVQPERVGGVRPAGRHPSEEAVGEVRGREVDQHQPDQLRVGEIQPRDGGKDRSFPAGAPRDDPASRPRDPAGRCRRQVFASAAAGAGGGEFVSLAPGVGGGPEAGGHDAGERDGGHGRRQGGRDSDFGSGLGRLVHKLVSHMVWAYLR